MVTSSSTAPARESSNRRRSWGRFFTPTCLTSGTAEPPGNRGCRDENRSRQRAAGIYANDTRFARRTETPQTSAARLRLGHRQVRAEPRHKHRHPISIFFVLPAEVGDQVALLEDNRH